MRVRPEYLPDDGYVDEIAVERAVRGDPPACMTLAERMEAARRLTSWGYSAQEVADRIRVDKRSVVRYRAAGRSMQTA